MPPTQARAARVRDALVDGGRPDLPPPPALAARVRDALVDGQAPTPAAVAALLRAQGLAVGDAAVLDLVGRVHADMLGAGPLQSLLAAPGVTDVLVNGPRDVWVDRGAGLERAPVHFVDAAQVRSVATRLAAVGGRRLDDASPHVDARLPDGTRLHAVLPPVAPDGPLLSLRMPARAVVALGEWVAHDPTWEAWLRAIVEARLAFLVTGGTGTGKTTFLASLLSVVDPAERIVLIEDSSELRPVHPHVVRLECRTDNVEAAGRVGMRDLVRQSLRMRPDRVVVGEVRGAEVVDLLTALNTGHDGGCGTVHANAAADVPARLEALGMMAGHPREAVHSLVGAALHVVLTVRRRGASRYVDAVDVLQRGADGLVVAVPALRRGGGASGTAAGLDHLRGLLAARGVACS